MVCKQAASFRKVSRNYLLATPSWFISQKTKGVLWLKLDFAAVVVESLDISSVRTQWLLSRSYSRKNAKLC